MSTLVVEVCEVNDVARHPYADRLGIATVKGWKTVIGYNPETNQFDFKPGDKCIFFPPDAVLPPELANSPYKVCKNASCDLKNKTPVQLPAEFRSVNGLCTKCHKELEWKDGTPGRTGAMAFCANLPKDYPVKGGRVKATNIRGLQSFGFIIPLNPSWGDDLDWPVCTNVKDHFGVTKWEPPLEATDGDAESPHNYFHAYTDMEHYGNFPEAIAEGEEVIFTEKLHGKNTRVGLIMDSNEKGEADWKFMAGSHGVRRKEYDTKGRRSEFWEPLTDNVKAMLQHMRNFGAEIMQLDQQVFSVVLFGEIFGSGVQDMAYGMKNGQRAFRVFDLAINRKYMDFDKLETFCKTFNVPMVPVLYRGPFSVDVLERETTGPTTITNEVAGKFKGREGLVIKPVAERYSDIMIPTSTNGRVILKSVSADYLARKDGTDSH